VCPSPSRLRERPNARSSLSSTTRMCAMLRGDSGGVGPGRRTSRASSSTVPRIAGRRATRVQRGAAAYATPWATPWATWPTAGWPRRARGPGRGRASRTPSGSRAAAADRRHGEEPSQREWTAGPCGSAGRHGRGGGGLAIRPASALRSTPIYQQGRPRRSPGGRRSVSIQ
jgi:hypothetical protein